MIIFVWILCSAWVMLVTEAVVCAPSKPNLASYGSYCISSSQCQTNHCTGNRCVCPSGNYYHSCSYSCVPNCNTTIYSSYGFLVSPNYPNNYKNYENCFWTIYRATGHVLSFTITDYNLETCCDTIKVYGGTGQSSPLIGAISLSNNSFVASSSYMHIVFKTDGSVIRTGFNGTFQTHACTTTTQSTYGNIVSPGYPAWSMRYGSCSWSIVGTSSDNFIAISFHGFDLGACSTSNVTVVGSLNNVVYGSVCYTNYNTLNVNATTNRVTIRYSANKVSTSNKGFNATYLIYSLSKGLSCKITDQCKASLTCLNGVCDCISPEIFDTFTGRCTPRKSYGSLCDGATCETYLICWNDTCNCSSNNYYHDSTTKSCSARLSYNSTCSNYSSENQCQSNMVCVNSRCTCQSSEYYDAVSNLCRNRKSYGYLCTSGTCETYLTCLSSICNCSSYNYYHDSTTKSCRSKLSYNSICSIYISENQCQSNMVCVNSRCACQISQYYNAVSNLCRDRKSYGSFCTSSEPCETYLTCVSGICNCSSPSYYHDSTTKTCKAKLSYYSICNIYSSENQCQSNLACVNSRCTCSSSQYYDSGSNSCRSRKSYGSFCTSIELCEAYLTCLSGICNCPSASYYHDSTTKTCKARKSYGSFCTSSEPCETYLTCVSGICNCSSASYYHDSTTKTCKAKLSYNSVCNIYSSENQCQSNLACVNSRCTCSSSQYYDSGSNSCRSRKSYGSFCTSSEPCETYLTCVSGICNCSSASYYHDSTTKTCKAKLSYNSVCNVYSSENQCQSNFECVNSRCTCSSSQYYDSGFNLCRSRTSHGSSCSSDTCVPYLTCLSGMCQCSSNHYHDDAGKSCTPKSHFGGNCTNQSQCLGNVNCINKQCVCTPEQFYNPASILCQNKLESKAVCNASIDGMCRGPNLQCLPDVHVTPRCLCKEDMYEYLGSCLLLQEIKVSWPTAGRRTTDTIELRWTPNRNGAIVTYQSIATPLGSPQDVRRYDARNYGINVTGLQPGLEYNITILTITSPDNFYSPRSVGLEFVTETAPPVPRQIDASTSFLSRPPYRLSFQKPSGYVYKYKVVLSDGEFTSTYQVNASELTLTDLKSGTLYFYSITAYNKEGDYSEAVVGSFKTESQDDEDQLAVIIGASVASVIVIILITLAVVVIRRRRKGAGKPTASSNVEMKTTPNVERVPLARQNSYKNVPKAIAPVPPKKPFILEDNHVYEVYGSLQNKLATLDKTESSTDDCNSAAKSDTSEYSNGAFAGDETESSAAIKDDENVYQNIKLGVKSVKK
ncbi:unnamed protein product [Lymnaea stagnalis]|uniref:Uncharacterized protein n=1 Tax=Lymnaea stagnalis TaxID=6523 RepID=A0AAV2I6A0_LYMST